MQSCFPVVIKFKNGDIAIYHGNNSGIHKDLFPLLKRTDVMEIEIFEKESNSTSHAGRVEGFTKNVMQFFQKYKNSSPDIRVSPQNNRPQYVGVIVCKLPSGEAITCIGESLKCGGIAKSVTECDDKSDQIKEYKLVSAQERYSISKEDMSRFKDDIEATKNVIKDEKKELKKEQNGGGPSCTIL